MTLYDSKLYMEDVANVAEIDLPWELLQNKTVMLSGATGLIGSFLIDVILQKNEISKLNCTVIALVRDIERAKERFHLFADNSRLFFAKYDVREALVIDSFDRVDYVLHLASNTHPLQYSTDPIGTITTNIIGLQNMLEFSVENNVTRFVFASSNEVYGENRGDVEVFKEEYCGYIDSNTLRAGYPESKRCGEALCQAYKTQKSLNVVIPRFTRTYGPTMKKSDTKAISQFIKKGVAREDIVLKSEGFQYYSYQYVADSVSGLLTIVLRGENGEAYNIAEEHSDIVLRDLASIIAEMNNKSVVFEIPDAIEAAGYSTATKARLDGNKLRNLGWNPAYRIEQGVERTIKILREVQL